MGAASRALVVMLASVAAGLLGPAAAAASDNAPGRPLAVMPQAGGDDVLFQGAGGDLYENVFANGAWGTPFNTGIGPLGSAPAVSLGPGGKEYVFWAGADHALWYATSSNGTSWQGTTRVGLGPLGGQPAATAWGTSSGIEVDVFWQGTDGQLWEGWEEPSGAWNGPRGLGEGQLGSAPTAFSAGNSAGTANIDAYWEGTGPGYDIWTGGTGGGPSAGFSGPSSIGKGPLGSAPSVDLLEPSGQENLFWRGTNGALWQATTSGSGWAGPTQRGFGPLDSAPTAAAVWPAEQDVFWIGPSGLWEATDEDGTWSGPVGPGAMAVPPAATTTPVTVSTPTPTPGAPSRRPPALRAKITTSWTWNRHRTTLTAITIRHLPRHATITITCAGRGCPRDARASGRGAVGRLRRRLDGSRYRPGDHLLLTISAPNLTAERVRITIRTSAVPAERLL